MSEFEDADGNLLSSKDRRAGRRPHTMDGLTSRELMAQEKWEDEHGREEEEDKEEGDER